MRPIAAILLILVLAAGCGAEKHPRGAATRTDPGTGGGDQGPGEMKFDVDPALLGFDYADSTLHLRFSPPRGWPPIESTILDAAKQAIRQFQIPGERFASRPVRIFCEKEHTHFMILSEFPNWVAPLDPHVAFADYRRIVQGRVSDVQIQDSFFRHQKLDFYQLLLSNPIMVNTRVIILRTNRPPVQVDYLVSRGAYESQAKGIEASIGSFREL